MHYFNQILDQYDEKILNEKLAEDLPSKPTRDQDYALILNDDNQRLHKYPINNVENAAFSYAALQKNGYKLNEDMFKIASSQIKRVLDFYGIENDLLDTGIKTNEYKITNKDLLKLASSTQHTKKYFAVYNEDGVGYLPLDTELDVRDALKEFEKNAVKLSVLQRKTCAKNIIKRASQLDVEIPKSIEAYTSIQPADKPQLKVAMATRYTVYPSKVRDFVTELIDNIKTAEDHTNVLLKIEQIDNELKINQHKHMDLAAKFFKKANNDFADKLTASIDSGELSTYLDTEVIDLLKLGGEQAYEKLNPRIKSVILNIIK